MPGHVATVYRSQNFQEISFTCHIQAFSKYTIFGRGGWVGVASQGWLTIAWSPEGVDKIRQNPKKREEIRHFYCLALKTEKK